MSFSALATWVRFSWALGRGAGWAGEYVASTGVSRAQQPPGKERPIRAWACFRLMRTRIHVCLAEARPASCAGSLGQNCDSERIRWVGISSEHWSWG
jgi:hypothetical protein